MNDTVETTNLINHLSQTAQVDWSGARCIDRPQEFCPSEDIMTNESWTKKVAPARAKECLSCPAFDQCEKSLLAEMAAEDLSPTGIMAGVVLVQKSQKQILNALDKVKKSKAPHPQP